MDRELIVTLVFWGLALALAIWTLVPPIAQLLGFSSVRIVQDAGPDDLWAERDQGWIAPLYRKLESAGFQPLARVKSQMFLEGVKWRHTIVSRLYAADDSLISVYQLLPFEAPRCGMRTIFTDGRVLDTGSSMPELRADEPIYRRWGIQTSDPLELIAAHRRRLAEVLAVEGGQVASPRSVEAYEKMAQAEWNSACVQGIFRDVALQNLTGLGWWSLGAVITIWRNPTWLYAACSVLAVFVVHLGFRYAGFAWVTVESWCSRRGLAHE